MRFFNTEGPVRAEMHYTIPPLSRLNLPHLERLIDAEKYILLHAPRQTGKTSCLLALARLINEKGKCRALYVNIEAAQALREKVDRAMQLIAFEISQAAIEQLDDTFPRRHLLGELKEHPRDFLLTALLSDWSRQSPKPLVLILDEIDSLVGDTLLSVLRQLRSGYTKRPHNFPQSVILCGLRDVGDFPINATGSPFNIKAESLRLGDFTRDEVATLCGQHTEETGQAFEPAALDRIWELTNGQPWLVNALANEVTWNVPEGGARTAPPISFDLIERAKESLIGRRVVHIDQLAHKLREERVKRIVSQILVGEDLRVDLRDDDAAYCEDLGLIRRGPGGVEIANPIYREVIPRYLTADVQEDLQGLQRTEWYVRIDGTLDIPALMAAFQQFFRENSEHWLERFDYKEAGPQLLLQAFLQRIVNGGGRIEREYGLGRGRTDLLVIWPHQGGTQRVVFELKASPGPPAPLALEKALAQTAAYMDCVAADEGHLVWFDRSDRGTRSWDDKIQHEVRKHGGHTIQHWSA